MKLNEKYKDAIAALNEFLKKTENLGDEGWIYLINRDDFVDPELHKRREMLKHFACEIARGEVEEEFRLMMQRMGWE